MSHDPRIDAYIARQADFARPILEHLREVVQRRRPRCEETIKWSMPHFTYKGRMFAGMAAFKAHATFGLWQGEPVLGETGSERERDGAVRAAGLARRSAARAEILDQLIRKAHGPDRGRRKAAAAGRRSCPSPSSKCPPELRAALDGNPAARATFEGFPPSARRDYLEWVVEAKRPETRAKRLAAGGRMDVRGQETALEIRELLKIQRGRDRFS